ncbi:MAG TPA: substrate-binding domain-containing protein, partial [Verrucomicrobiota bacterium]|nr:substrate-binding domain-containing protein [Verrucomicrobiota bacterium]
DELDVSRQIDLVEQMISQRVDAIVIAPADSKALIPVCKKAKEKGIVVINIDNKFDEEVLEQNKVSFPFVGPDNRLGARKVGEYVAKKLKPGDKVAIIEGVPSAFNGVQRKLGFEDAIRSAKLTLVSSQSGYWETDKANKVASAIITEHPDIKAFLCANDSMAIGVVAALRDAGKLGQVLVAGYDNISAVQQLLKEGKIIATADQHADKLAIYGIEYALEIIKEKITPLDFDTPVDLITAETLSSNK